MKNLNTKSLLVITLVFSSLFAMPIAAMGQETEYNDQFVLNQFDEGIFDGFRSGFGALFGNHLGYGGKILGTLFETLFLQGMNLTKFEMLDNVFVLSANRSHLIPGGTYNFALEDDTEDIYLAPHEYNELIPAITMLDMRTVLLKNMVNLLLISK
jgi:hypothetical protein